MSLVGQLRVSNSTCSFALGHRARQADVEMKVLFTVLLFDVMTWRWQHGHV